MNNNNYYYYRVFLFSLFFYNLLNLCVAKDPWYYKIPADDNLTDVPDIIKQNEKYYPAFKDLFLTIVGKTGEKQHLVKKAKNAKKIQNLLGSNVAFPCKVEGTRSKERPTDAHSVRPGDIDVVAAIGDSLTAGNGAFATSMLEVMVENRGVSFPIGGYGNWRQYLTIPNILKEFNPNLMGYSKGDSFTHHAEAEFDMAEIGAMSQDLPYMAKQLVKKLKKDPRINFQNDWKLVTMMMGSNNFCLDLCYQDAKLTPEMHRKDLIKTFEFLRDNLPRTIISMVLSPNLKILLELKGFPQRCEFVHLYECPCLCTIQHRHKLKLYYKVMEQWQQVEQQVVDDARFKTKDDFTIVMQMFTKDLKFPLVRNKKGEEVTDFTYMSYDCFHFSQKGYSRVSNALWNNMMEPVGSKSIDWNDEFKNIICPNENSPYIYTWKNSNNTRIVKKEAIKWL